ncbi:MAG: class IIb bacteriocin, lactobin A/cerein 7B family [Christensenellaceae bacterium]|nr:class IIb bacteriocin, lactobin A/cerein 7B family [Christensenellaceae bacterium]
MNEMMDYEIENELTEYELEDVSGGTPPLIVMGLALAIGTVLLVRGCKKKK